MALKELGALALGVKCTGGKHDALTARHGSGRVPWDSNARDGAGCVLARCRVKGDGRTNELNHAGTSIGAESGLDCSPGDISDEPR